MSLLSQLSDDLAAVVERVGRSVVRVEARRRGNASGIAWSADGLVLASDHTVQRDDDLRVGLPDGSVVEAELVGRDPSTDLALLRTDAALEPPDWVAAADVAVGHLVLSVGRHDAHAQAALGIVAQRDGAWQTAAGGRVDAFIQTDVGVYPGFSGSALATAGGQVAGLNTSWFGRRSSLTLPPATLRRVAGQLAEHGRVRQGYLGVTTQPVRLRHAGGRAGEGAGRGLLVLDVADDSPAADAGVLVGDVLTGVGDHAVHSLRDLLGALLNGAGRAVTLHLHRGGAPTTVDVTLGER